MFAARVRARPVRATLERMRKQASHFAAGNNGQQR
jgi:hypothetical protein